MPKVVLGQFTQQWDQFYGNAGYDELILIEELSDGYLYMGSIGDAAPFTGGASTTYGSTDYWLVRTDFDGNILWQQNYGGAGNDTLQDAIPTSDGGYLLGGFSYSAPSGVKTAALRGSRDMWIIKLAADGSVEWDAAYGGDNEDYLRVVQQTADGGYILGGWTKSPISGDITQAPYGVPSPNGYLFDYWVVKTDATGGIEWTQRYGGDQEDLLQAIHELPDGGFLLAGQSRSDISGDKTEDAFGTIGSSGVKSLDYWVLRTDAAGNIIWDRTFGGVNSDAAHNIVLAADGNYFIGGYARSPMSDTTPNSGNKIAETRGAQDYWLIKIDLNGNKLLDRAYGGDSKDFLHRMRLFHKDHIALIGLSESDISGDRIEASRGVSDYWLVVVDQQGDIVYQKALGGDVNDNLWDVRQLSTDGSLIVGGFTFSNTSGDITDSNIGLQDAWVTKLDCDLEIDLGNDTLICQKSDLLLDVFDETICSYEWSTGATSSSIEVCTMVDTMYAVTVTTIYGCIEKDTIQVTVKETPFFSLGDDITVCEGDTAVLSVGSTMADIEWSTGAMSPDITVSASGDYMVTLTNANACTYSDTLTFYQHPLPDVDFGADQFICPNESISLLVSHPGPLYEWSSTTATSQAITVDTAGTYSVTVTDDNTCTAADTIEVMQYTLPLLDLGADMTICDNTTILLDASISPCNSCIYEWEDASTNPIRVIDADESQTYMVTVTDDNACMQADTIQVTITSSPIVSLGPDMDICVGDSVLLTFDLMGTGPYMIAFAEGADVRTLEDIEDGHSIWVHPTETTTYSLLLVEDSSEPTTCIASAMPSQTISVYQHEETLVDVVLCAGESHFAEGAFQTTSGIYYDTLQTIYSCDSIVITNLEVHPVDTTMFEYTTCDPANVGIDTLFLLNQYDCDSLVVETTTLLPSDTIRLEETTCNLLEVGVDTLFLENQWACDSLIITETTLLPSDTVYFSFESCESSEVGIDTLFLENQWGCDSLVIEETTLLPKDTIEIEVISCEMTAVGLDTFSLLNQFGCDSLVIQNTVFAESDTLYLDNTTCEIAQAGADTLFLLNQYGCDSLVIETTTLLPRDTILETVMTCEPSEAGIDTLFLENQYGCDSLHITNTTLVESFEMNFYFTTCNPSEADIDTLFLLSENGCDSLIITTTEWQMGDTIYVNATTCDPAQAGTDTLFLENQWGCDSLQIMQTDLLPSDTTVLQEATCDQMALVFEELLLQNQYGCDSLVQIERTILPLDTTYSDTFSCELSEVGQDTLFLENQWGCDSLHVLSIAFAETDTTLLEIYTCDETEVGVSTDVFPTSTCDSVVLTTILLMQDDTTYLESYSCDPMAVGTIQSTLTTIMGCDSVIIETITLADSYELFLTEYVCSVQDTSSVMEVYITEQGCDSLVSIQSVLGTDTMYVEGTSCLLEETGVFFESYTNQLGCDSTIVTTIDLLEGNVQVFSSITCDPNEVLNDTTFYTNSVGCDSLIIEEVVLLELEVALTYEAETCVGDQDALITVASVEGGVAPYLYALDGTTFSNQSTFVGLTAGTYTITVQDSNGCEDSAEVTIPAPSVFEVDLGEDVYLNLGESAAIEFTSSQLIDTFSWIDTIYMECGDCPMTMVAPAYSTLYQVEAMNAEGCIATDDVWYFVNRDFQVYIPSAFSPNEDGINDIFRVFAGSSVAKIHAILIVDRWGNMVYENHADDILERGHGWDGTFRGKPMNPAVFVYQVEVEFLGGERQVFAGDLTLVR